VCHTGTYFPSFLENFVIKGFSFLTLLQSEKNSKRISTKNYRLPFEKQKLPIVHKWVDGIKIICSLRFVVFLKRLRFLYNSNIIAWAVF
jgi:hypothetical protein